MELDVINYLADDPNLRALLQGTIANTKIYPAQAPHGAELPYILYTISDDGTTEENLLERSFSFNCVSETELESEQIREKVVELLDYQDKIRRKIISSTYWFYWAKHVGGANYKDPEIDAYYSIAIVAFKYAKITIEDIEMIIKLYDRLGQFIDGTNPLPVAPMPQDSVLEFDEIDTISASSTWNTILTYTVSSLPLFLDGFIVEGTVPAEYMLFVDTAAKIPCRTAHMDRTGNVILPPGQKFEVGQILDIKVRHAETETAAFKASLLGHKHTP